MAQIKIFARRETIERHRAALSDAIHAAVMQALAYTAGKRFHRFIGLAPEDFLHPDDRSESYLIVEISMFEGRSAEARKALVRAIFANVTEATGISAQDVEITIFETPRGNWTPRRTAGLGWVSVIRSRCDGGSGDGGSAGFLRSRRTLSDVVRRR